VIPERSLCNCNKSAFFTASLALAFALAIVNKKQENKRQAKKNYSQDVHYSINFN
jgi:hypothetical protein